MRQKCSQTRSSEPDKLFRQMLKDPDYFWLHVYFENHQSDYDDEYEDDEYQNPEEDEEYEDDLIRANKAAGFQINDDGEIEYLED